MIKKKFYLLFLLFLLIEIYPPTAHAFWMWTPETNQWINPKYAVKETPAEQLAYGLEFYNARQYKEAIREFGKLIRHYPRAREAPDSQYYIGQSLQALGKPFGAFKSYQKVVEKYPFSERSAEIVRLQYDIGVQLLEGNNERGVMKTVLGNEYDVVDIFKTVIKNAPYGELAPPAQYKIALYLQEKGLFQEARDEFEKVMNDYPESEWAKAAHFQIAMTDAKRSTDAQYDQKVTQAAVQEFEKFAAANPGAELSKQAKEKISELREKEAENSFLVAQFYEKQKNYKAAKIYYQTIVDDYKNTKWAQKALARIAQLSQKE